METEHDPEKLQTFRTRSCSNGDCCLRTSLIDRRDFLRAAGFGFVAAMAPSAWAETLAADAVFATAFVKRDGSYGAAVLSEAGKILHTVDLPDRGPVVPLDP